MDQPINITEEQINQIIDLRVNQHKTIPEITEITGFKKHTIRKYIETKKYGNDRYLVDLSNISKSIYEIGERFRNDVLLSDKRGGRKDSSAELRLFYLDYETGSRIGELIRQDYPFTIELEKKDGWSWIKCRKINEKHFKAKERVWVQQVIPVTNEWDAKIVERIFNAGQNGFEMIHSSFSYERLDQISSNIKRDFKADLRDSSGTTYTQAGINPHLLRHFRAYSLLVNLGFRRTDVQAMMCWDDADMVDYYTYIREKLQADDLQRNLLNSLKESFGNMGSNSTGETFNKNSLVKPFHPNINTD